MQIGDTLPPSTAFVFKDGEKTAQSFLGKKLVVYFYPKDDTPGCTTEAKDFTALADDFAAANCVIVGVSKDTLSQHQKFCDKHALRIPLASDEHGSLCQLFDVWKERSMYGKKFMGIERSTFVFDTKGQLTHEWRKVKVPDHAAQVLDVIKAIS